MKPIKKRVNPRKQFARFLRRLLPEDLRRTRRRVQRQFRHARQHGHCVMEAVLYFDLEQVKEELQRRRKLRARLAKQVGAPTDPPGTGQAGLP